jgi:PKD repeat protein
MAFSISFDTQARVVLAQANVPVAANSGFSASPISGLAPLIVGFRYEGSRQRPAIDFGDGSSSAMNAAPTCASCVPVHVVSHRYAAAGTYTATLRANGEAAGTIAITVTSP